MEELAVGQGVVEAVEGHGLNVVDQVRQLFWNFLENKSFVKISFLRLVRVFRKVSSYKKQRYPENTYVNAVCKRSLRYPVEARLSVEPEFHINPV